MRIEAETPYYLDALRNPVETIWGRHPIYGQPGHIEDICFYQMLSSFYENDKEDIRNRKDLLYSYLAGPFETGTLDSTLDKLRRWLPSESFLVKVTNALAIAYNDAPTRAWRRAGTDTPHPSSDLLARVYRQIRADGYFQTAHRYAKLASGCVVRPYVGARGRIQIEILSPDLCRIETRPGFPDTIDSLTRPLVRSDGATVFEMWEATRYRYLDYRGDDTWFDDGDGGRLTGDQANPYGRVPYIVMRLVEPLDVKTFSGGLFEIAEQNLHRNKIRWLGDASITYESFGHWVAQNLGLKGHVSLGFGKMTIVENAGDKETGEAPPNLFNVATNGQYGQMGPYGSSYVEEMQMAAGLPESDVVRQGGTPPSGISRYIARLGLLEQRKNDILYLGTFEQDFTDLLCTVYNIDVAAKTDAASLPVPGETEIDVTFAEERILLEPDKAFDLYTKQFTAGVMTATQYVREVAGRDFATDEEAIAYIVENKRLYAAIASGGVPEPGTTTVTPPAAEVVEATGGEVEPAVDAIDGATSEESFE